MKPAIRILIVDDHSLVRDGMEAILRLESDFQDIAHASSCAEALTAVRADEPDLVLLDRRMPEGDGFDLLGELRHIAPQTRVIMMTSSTTPSEVARSRALGAAGHLSKNIRHATLLRAIRAVLGGGTCFEAETTLLPATHTLSPRQCEVLEHLSRGLSNLEIGQILSIGENTVKDHIKAIFAKLGAANRSEAVTIGFKCGILGL